MEIHRIDRVPLRSVWPREALNFTTWVRDNIEVLNDVLPFELSNAESEQAAGSFSVDIVAEDTDGETVIIENQLERSDHDHLGKLITYLTAFDARRAIWIVADARPEHVQAVAWLNESTNASFYLVKVEAVRIGDSPPAPLLTLIVGSSDEAKAIGRRKGEHAERHDMRFEFWSGLLDRARTRTPMFNSISPSRDPWLSTSSIPFRGMSLAYHLRQHDTGGYLYIDLGREDARPINVAMYQALYAQRADIEARFGSSLEWDGPNGHRRGLISFHLNGGGFLAQDDWDEIQELTIEAMARFWTAIEPSLRELPQSVYEARND